jgi:serine/threonine protein kinase
MRGGHREDGVGVRLGRYVLREHLAAGGLGSVWSAWDPELDRPVAIKVVGTSSIDGDSRRAMQRLVREAKAVARVSHPNVVTVYDVGTAEPANREAEVYVVLELVDGETLAQWLERERRRAKAILSVFVDVARGLAAVHRAGLVHRDVKPANIVVDGEGRARLLDFGLARAFDEDEQRLATSTADLDDVTTHDGYVVGTPAYMPPEQHAGAPAHAAADQYAFCVALCEALHGKRPFDAPSLDTLYRLKRRGPGPVLGGGGSRRLDRILRRGLSPDPRDRWPSMDELAAALQRATERRGAKAYGPWMRTAALGLAVPAAFALGDLHGASAARPAACSAAFEDLVVLAAELDSRMRAR